MQSSLVSLIIKSVTATWVAILVSGLVAFFLTPFVLHRLGKEGYGLWILVVSLTDYFMFLGLGLRSAVVRYVARYLAVGDMNNANRVIASGFYCFSGVCILVIAITLPIARYVPEFFAIQPKYVRAVVTLFMLTGLATALDFPLSILEGTLEAVGRFDQLYGVRILGQLLRAGLIVFAVGSGWGLQGLGAATILGTLGPRFFVVPILKHEMPHFSLHPHWIDARTLHDMFSYSSISFTIGLGQHLKTSLYPLLIAKFLTTAAITMFAIPLKVLQVPLAGTDNMTEYVNPMSSYLDAHKKHDKLRSVLITSVQASYLLLAPIAAMLLVFGKNLISLWAGNSYADTYPILMILTLGLGVDAAHSSAQSMLFGIGKHKGLIGYRIAEGLGVVALAVPMVRMWGVTGFAIAMMIPLVLTNCFLIPHHLSNILGMRLGRYLKDSCVLPNLLVAPMLLALAALRTRFAFHTWKGLILAGAIGLLVYLGTLVATASPRLPRYLTWVRLEVLELASDKIAERFRSVRAESMVFVGGSLSGNVKTIV